MLHSADRTVHSSFGLTTIIRQRTATLRLDHRLERVCGKRTRSVAVEEGDDDRPVRSSRCMAGASRPVLSDRCDFMTAVRAATSTGGFDSLSLRATLTALRHASPLAAKSLGPAPMCR